MSSATIRINVEGLCPNATASRQNTSSDGNASAVSHRVT
jgi:hypothetical protein